MFISKRSKHSTKKNIIKKRKKNFQLNHIKAEFNGNIRHNPFWKAHNK